MLHFAFPLFFAGAALLAVPLILHFLRKRPLNVEEFPSFYFLKREISRRKTKNNLCSWLVLLLRILALLCLAAAFAWPFFGAADKVPETATVVICDASYSTRTEEFQKTLDELLRDELKDVSPSNPAIGIIAADKLIVSGDPCGDGDMLMDFFKKRMAPSPTANDFSLALYRADGLLAGIKAGKRRIVILTDRQELPWKHLPEGSFLKAADEVIIRPDSVPQTTNARILPVKRRANTIQADVLCTGTKELAAELELLDGEKSLWKKKLALLPGKTQHVEIPSAHLGKRSAAHLVLHCPEDVIQDDNEWFEPPLPEETRHVQLYSSIRYPALNAAFESPEIVFTESEKWSDDPDLLLVGDSPLSDPDQVCEKIKSLLQGGSSAALLYSDTPFMRKLFEKFGAVIQSEKSLPDTIALNMLDLEHPILREYQKLGSASWFDLLFFKMPKIDPPAGAHVIASAEGNRPVIFEKSDLNGKLFFFAFAPDAQQTNFQTSGHFLPFWREMLEYGAEHGRKKVHYTVYNKTVKTPDGELDLTKPGAVLLKNTVYCVNTDRAESETNQIGNEFSIHAERQADANTESAKKEFPFERKHCMILMICALAFLLAELGISNRTA